MAEHVEVSVPAAPAYLSLVRLNVGSIASALEMTIDELEDLQLAVEELCLSLMRLQATATGRLQLRLEWSDERVEVRCTLDGAPRAAGDGAEGVPESLSRQILDALVDEHGSATERDATVAWLTKRRERTLPPA